MQKLIQRVKCNFFKKILFSMIGTDNQLFYILQLKLKKTIKFTIQFFFYFQVVKEEIPLE